MPLIPHHFTGGRVDVTFGSPLQVHLFCTARTIEAGGEAPEPGTGIVACAYPDDNGRIRVVLPNPCPAADDRGESYASIVCHELGHVAQLAGHAPFDPDNQHQDWRAPLALSPKE